MKGITVDGVLIEIIKNDFGGITLKIDSAYSDSSGSDWEYVNVYGNYAKSLEEKKTVLPGDTVSCRYESRNTKKVDPETGKTVRSTKQVNPSVRRLSRPRTQSAAPPVKSGGTDMDTY